MTIKGGGILQSTMKDRRVNTALELVTGDHILAVSGCCNVGIAASQTNIDQTEKEILCKIYLETTKKCLRTSTLSN